MKISWGRKAQVHVAPVEYDEAGAILPLDIGDLVRVRRLKDVTTTREAKGATATARDLECDVHDQNGQTWEHQGEKLFDADDSADDIPLLREAFDLGSELWVLITRGPLSQATGTGMLSVAQLFGLPESMPEAEATSTTLIFKPTDPDELPQKVTTPVAPPAWTVPGAQTTAEDTNKSIGGISLFGSAADTISVTIAGTHGTISLAQTTGLSFSVGNGTSDATMTFTGSLTNILAAIGTLTFIPTANFNGSASVSLSATGVWGTETSSIAVTVTSVNDAPVVTTSGGSTTYTENSAAVVIDGAITITDADSVNLTGLTAQITGNYQSTQDTLSATGLPGGISAVWNSGTGTLALSGTASVADYQAAARLIKYVNGSEAPNTSGRTVTFIATDGTVSSSAATKGITVVAVNDPPTVSTSGGSLSFTLGDGATVVDDGLVVSDLDTATFASGYVEIGAGYVNGDDVLDVVEASGITKSWNASTGRLSLSGTTTKANWQALLRGVTFYTGGGGSTGTRTISFVVNDGTDSSTPVTRDVDVSGGGGGTAGTWNVGADSNISGAADLQSSGMFPSVGSYAAINNEDASGADQTSYLDGAAGGGTIRFLGDDPGDDVTVTVAADADPSAATYLWTVTSIVSGSWSGASSIVTIEIL